MGVVQPRVASMADCLTTLNCEIEIVQRLFIGASLCFCERISLIRDGSDRVCQNTGG